MNVFQPDYTNILKVLNNQRPDYLPLYEHHIDPPFIAKCLGCELSIDNCKSDADLDDYFSTYISFGKGIPTMLSTTKQPFVRYFRGMGPSWVEN